jgi:hypothetical protein
VQTLILSRGISFAIPLRSVSGAGGQSGVVPYQGSPAQSISYAVIFNSRGLPIANDGTPVSDYALYLAGPNNTTLAVAVDASGRPAVYRLDDTTWKVVTN